ncbi:THUMP domain-containing protein [Methanothermobacter sp.]|uniref:THUMP domain-containing protein n=1 Tax=Methanothermobacter sp. TaxID=1884223 RepID=UPI0026243AC0|nr:THUMP domain-containing protein [Methanothermobacter sp.]MDI9614312.1 THUMP domain-containing protein [Methanothermobacter sp.]
MKVPESFNLIVTLSGQKGGPAGEEIVGIEEIEMALSRYEGELRVRDSDFPNVLKFDLDMDPFEAVNIIRNSPTTVISKVVPVEAVVRTRLDSIIERVASLVSEKVKAGESFRVICDLRGRRYIKSPEEVVEAVSDFLMERFPIKESEDPNWIIQIEVVGEATGVSVLKPHDVLKKG